MPNLALVVVAVGVVVYYNYHCTSDVLLKFK